MSSSSINVNQGAYRSIFEFSDRAIANRDQSTDSASKPSVYWQEYIRLFNYIRFLPETELERIRFHTHHLNSDGYLEYKLSNKARRERLAEEYRYYADRLRFDGTEKGNAIGIDFNGQGLINRDIIRYMMVLDDFDSSGKITRGEALNFLEIGGGYGGLARIIHERFAKAAYVLCDLEETLVFSAIYLTSRYGSENVHLVDRGGGVNLEPGHFYVVPQSVLETLSFSEKFDVAINQESMQEMTRDTVERYCGYMRQHANYFYSCNIDQHLDCQNTGDLVHSLNDVLIQCFGTPVWETIHKAGWLERKARKSRTFKQWHRKLAAHPAWVYNTNVIVPRKLFKL